MQPAQTDTYRFTTQPQNDGCNIPKALKIQPLLKNKAQWRCLSRSDISFISKSKPKMLSRVEITQLDIQNIKVQPLCRALKDLKRITSLDFLRNGVQSKDPFHLIHVTNHWKNLGIWDYPFSRKILKTLRIRRCKDLEYLLNSSIYMQREFFRQIKGLAKLKTLDFSLNERNLASVVEFNLHWGSVRDVSLHFPRNIENIQNLLQKIQHAEILKLQFGREYNMKVSEAQIWASFFQKAGKNLKSLIITLGFIEDHGTAGIQTFVESFKYLNKIAHLQFHFPKFIYSNKVSLVQPVFFKCLSASLGALIQLKSLDLTIALLKIKNSNLHDLVSALHKLKDLKTLSLNFSALESPAEGIVSLAQCIRNLNNLEALTLILKNPDLEKKPIETFFQNIAHLPLQSLRLFLGSRSMLLGKLIPSYPEIDFYVGKLTNNFWKRKQALFSSFGEFKLLSTLHLDLTSCYISTEEFKDFSAAVKQMGQLSYLSLRLPQSDPKDNFEGLANTLACVKDLPSLIELDLGYYGACLHYQEIALFGLNLKDCRNLQALVLVFPRATKLNRKALDDLLFGLKELVRLKKLFLMFDMDKGFGETFVLEFLLGLICLKDLEVLQFSQSAKLAEGGAALSVAIKEFENLRRLYEFEVNGVRYI